MSILRGIAEFFRTIWRVSFKPQEVYREFASVPARRGQGLTLLVGALIVGSGGALIILVYSGLGPEWVWVRNWVQNYYDRAVFFPYTEAYFGSFGIFFFLPGLIAQFITMAWIAYRIFPGEANAWPALGLSLSPGFLVGGAGFLLWLLALGLKSIWIQPLLFLYLGAFNPILFTLAFPAAYAPTVMLAEYEQELWYLVYWLPVLVLMAGLALWQGWLIYTAARKLGDNQYSYPAGLVLVYALAINVPFALVGAALCIYMIAYPYML